MFSNKACDIIEREQFKSTTVSSQAVGPSGRNILTPWIRKSPPGRLSRKSLPEGASPKAFPEEVSRKGFPGRASGRTFQGRTFPGRASPKSLLRKSPHRRNVPRRAFPEIPGFEIPGCFWETVEGPARKSRRIGRRCFIGQEITEENISSRALYWILRRRGRI